MPWSYLLIISVCFVVAYWATPRMFKYLVAKRILDIPNDRSNHHRPIPRGGGVAVLASIVVGWLLMTGWVLADQPLLWHKTMWLLLGAALLLATVNFFDDINHLSAWIRLFAQMSAIAVGLVVVSSEGALVFQGYVPAYLDLPLTAFCWLWFINLYNFMDGIDGITGSQTLSICVGVIAVALLASLPQDITVMALVIAAAISGFLVWNWHPARIFIGDTGSIALGYLIGFLLIKMALYGHLAVAFILPGYYLVDATYTIMQRLCRGEKIWQAHSQHFFQQAVRMGRSHSRVVIQMIVTNAVLILLAIISALYPTYTWIVFICAGFMVGSLVWWLIRKPVHSSNNINTKSNRNVTSRSC